LVSLVHAVPAGSLLLRQVPAEQLSGLSQSVFPEDPHVFVSSFGCVQLPDALHTSSVHALPSLVHAVPAGSKQLSAVSLQASAHSGPPAHGLPAWLEQAPPLHASVPLQYRPSSQGEPFAGAHTDGVPLHE
jgi:hypothetical protein